jgi:hypothetical protein
MANDRNPTYEVGFGKPPRYSRFQKGQSGNPKGRHKGSKNLATLLDEELNVRVPINENGKRKTITMRKVISKQTVRKAASGNERFIKLIYEWDRLKGTRDGVPSGAELIDEDDEQVMRDLIRDLDGENAAEDEGSKSS